MTHDRIMYSPARPSGPKLMPAWREIRYDMRL